MQRFRSLPAVVLLFLLSGSAAAQQPVARITALTGLVTKRHLDKWQIVNRTPVDLYDDDKVATDRGRATVVFLGDNSTLTLDVGTNITIQQRPAPQGGGLFRKIELFAGDLWFKMTKSSTQYTAMVTPTAVAGLRGTEGTIHVENENDASYQLKDGELEIAQREEDGSVKEDANVTYLHKGEKLKAVRGVALATLQALIWTGQPDLNVAANLLPKVDPKRLAHLSDSDRPDVQALQAAAGAAAEVGKRKVQEKIPNVKIPF